jgi:D-hydroxyproline dehydrogenase subunit beta
MAQNIIIAGAGIIGAALAFRLAQTGARVTVLDAGPPAGQASGASFGWINASFFASPAHHALRANAILAHRDLAVDLGPTGALWPGALWWEGLDDLAATLHDLGYPVRHVDRAGFAVLEPQVAHPPERALLFGAEGAVDAADLTQRLLAAATARGAQLWLGCAVTGLLARAGAVTGVMTAQGPIIADHVILATGTATPALLAPLDLTLPLLQRPGGVLRTHALRPTITHILVSPAQEARQDAAGRIIAPLGAAHQADARDHIAGQPGTLAEATLLRLRALLPDAPLVLDQLAIAQRPVPKDGLPVVGQVMPGLTLAVMHSGVTLAPLIAECVAAEVRGQGDDPQLAPFRLARFTGGS